MGNLSGPYRRVAVVGLDLAAFAASYWLAFQLRFDFNAPAWVWPAFWRTIWVVLALRGAAFSYLGAYQGLWRYASLSDLWTLAKAMAASQVVVIAATLFLQHADFPRSVLIIDPVLALILVGSMRLGIRLTREQRWKEDAQDLPRLLIFGAGDLGESIVRDMQRRKRPTHRIVGFVDDDRAKWHMRIHGVPILGGRQVLPRLIAAHGVDEVVVALNHSRGGVIRELMELCKHHGDGHIQFKTVPTIEENLRGESGRHRGLRKVELSDLLQRKPVHTDLEAVRHILAGKSVLVTGAGGSIGSELCRQIQRFKPAKLILLENHNTALFYIDRELSAARAPAVHVPVAGDVGDETTLENLFLLHKPQLVFHAAAHKHVPLMESNPQEAVKNNTLNTHLLAEMSVKHGVERFLYISTDKAVRPANVMGASKRLGEMVIRALSETSATKFMSVRFGNVLGSSGSAINIFKEQIAAGGPLTVTHPDVTRYFMTTQEAVHLILQACALGGGGEIFVLNMGESVKVVDVARSLILLSGLEPERDIKISFTGLRPGEKLFEEIFREKDVRKDTGHPDIFSAVPEEADLALMRGTIRELDELCSRPDPAPLLAAMKKLVPFYKADGTAGQSR
ncbi:MAG: polysaccharide biosynthesis protein [Elusimicrobia bacterium]|nr:polysaccharide biosynthesis protein [Elusimicrobiota bacterium]